MKHSDKITAQLVVNACEFYGVKQIVISPGSRNAPLIIEFNQSKKTKKFSIVDERSAGFFALGMAKSLGQPVALVCSSGSALLNYYPAIAEAFYSRIPLIVISADRPQHLIDIGDGQTIRQPNVFANHIGFSANLTENNPTKLINSAFLVSQNQQLPVHINIPFDEPLYQTTSEYFVSNSLWENNNQKTDSLLSQTPIPESELEQFANKWNTASKKMLLLGEYPKNDFTQVQLEHLIKDPSVIVLTENTSNVVHPQFINSIDQAIFPFSETDFLEMRPEILLTFGGMIVSKKIKQLLRQHPPKEHWHVSPYQAQDTYHSLTHHFKVSPTLFFSQFFFMTETKSGHYQDKWLALKSERLNNHHAYIKNCIYSDLKVFEQINKAIPSEVNLQFSNSSIIRYAQLFPWQKEQTIGCNRGTSGIDGATSTAVGVAVANANQTVFVTGDIGFFYDSNALWNSYIPKSFRIILINNQGGGIFKFIPGPESTKALDFFETPHKKTAKQLCDMHEIGYQTATNSTELTTQLKHFFDDKPRAQLLEVMTPSEINARVLKEYFRAL